MNYEQPHDDKVRCTADAGFAEWISRSGGVLAVTTYQANKVAFVGWDGEQVSLLMRDFDKPMGLAVEGTRMALATRHEVLVFANAPRLAHEYLEEQPGRYDALYLPRAAYYTGDLNVHDIAYTRDGLAFVNTRFSCLASCSMEYNFVQTWRPPFVGETAPEDRCHLNGLAVADDQPAYVTAHGATDAAGGWRTNREAGGVVVRVADGETMREGLCMPHSPRCRDGFVWLLNSGRGELCQLDVARGGVNVVCAAPGYLRGLCLVGDYAVVGLSRIRESHLFGGMPVQSLFSHLKCGLAVIELSTGVMRGMFEFTEGCHELYDVQFIAGVSRPNVLNLVRPEARQGFTCVDEAYWLRPGAVIDDS